MADSKPGRERVKISPELVLSGEAGCRALIQDEFFTS